MKKLRRKMIFIVFLSVVFVFVLTLIIVKVSLDSYNSAQADSMTLIISTNNGTVPKIQEYENFYENFMDALSQFALNEESAFSTRYFVVYLTEDLQIKKADIEHIASVDEETACEMAMDVISSGAEVGYTDDYRYRIAEGTGGDILVIFLDCSESLKFQNVITTIFLFISVGFTVLITLIFSVCSNYVLKPFAENSRKQKQFITDAGHELKTPLAIISANAEVLQYKNGNSEWIDNITGQVHHMGELINDLLTLSKMEEFDGSLELESVNLTEIANETLDNFREVFNKKNVTMDTSIAPDIKLNGNLRQLRMLISILVENASKYVSESGLLKVSLQNSGKHTVFKISNTAQIGDDVNLKLLFDRFYRPDSSRTSGSGGHGIGLSIAKQIASLHGGSISAKRVDDGICFTVEISNNIKIKNKPTGKK